MGFLSKCGHYLSKVGELLWDNPRESNTEGGLFPAIFGTVMLIFLMAITCFPLGVLAGIYLGDTPRTDLRTAREDRRQQPGRHPFDCLRHLRSGFFCVRHRRTVGPSGSFRAGRRRHADFRNRRHPLGESDVGLLTVPVVIVSTEEACGRFRGPRAKARCAGGDEIPDPRSRARADGFAPA